MFVEKWFFIFDKNQLVISSKLCQWSAEFLASLPLNDDVVISFTRAFFSFGTWCGISCCKFFMWLDVMKRFIHQNSVFVKIYAIKLSKCCAR